VADHSTLMRGPNSYSHTHARASAKTQTTEAVASHRLNRATAVQHANLAAPKLHAPLGIVERVLFRAVASALGLNAGRFEARPSVSVWSNIDHRFFALSSNSSLAQDGDWLLLYVVEENALSSIPCTRALPDKGPFERSAKTAKKKR